MMKPENIGSPEDMVRYIEGCLNDFEANLSTKAETIDAILDLIQYFLTKKIKQ